MTYVYNKSGQRLYFVREESEYGHPYDPEDVLTKFTILAADYPHWRRFDLVPDSQDIVIPIIEKIKSFDISDSKHASAIFSGNIEPVDFTIDMEAQGLEFLPNSFGPPAFSSHTQAMVETITCTTKALTIDESYFIIDVIVADNTVEHHVFWFDNAEDGTPPTITGINASNVHEMAIHGATEDSEVADVVYAIINGVTGLTAPDPAAAIITVTHDNDGAVIQAHDLVISGCTFAVTTWGATTYTITEALDTNLPSFTIHVEQRNTTSGEDIVWDIFGCVVDSVDVSVNFGDKIVKCSVTFKTPYALENSNGRNTNPPPKKMIDAFPTMLALKESAAAYLIMEGTTDRTPQTVDSVTLNITNNVTFKGDLAARHAVLAVAGKRDIALKIVGATQEKQLFTYWQGAYKASGTDWIPTSASGKLNSKFKLQRDATYDYINISFYNWLLKEHNFVFVDVDEAVKSVEMTLEDGSSYTDGRIIDSATYISYIDRTVMIEKDTV